MLSSDAGVEICPGPPKSSRTGISSGRLDVREYVLEEVAREPRALLVGRLEALAAAVVGVVDLLRLPRPGIFSPQLNLGPRLRLAPLLQSFEVLEVVLIHGKHVVELVKIGEADLARGISKWQS